ncbi:hypothetical protein TNCV_4224451 [Trichonephila clavipes]|nr:hypothetical protein TNCV_4224451 [Trichonephila clavipes]
MTLNSIDMETAIHPTATTKCMMECQYPKHTSQDYPKAALSSDLINSRTAEHLEVFIILLPSIPDNLECMMHSKFLLKDLIHINTTCMTVHDHQQPMYDLNYRVNFS